jgi:uncharacterized protein (TIGR00375 family)
MVGGVDAGTLPVAQELEEMLQTGELRELRAGGFLARNGVLLIAACELESIEGVHWVIYLPAWEKIREYQRFIRSRVSNMQLSTQKVRISAKELINMTCILEGILCPAHAFTPHKGIYGFWTDSLKKALGSDYRQIRVIELGLSSDSDMAATIDETRAFTFLTNSDAHSPDNIGREFNRFRLKNKNFLEFKYCLENAQGRRIMANFGLDPRLGKYHRSYCISCSTISTEPPPVSHCYKCGSDKMVMGVYDRIAAIQDRKEPGHMIGRPPYYYRVPIKQLPGVGPKTYEKMLNYFGSEINIMEEAAQSDLARIAGEQIADMIVKMRTGRLPIIPGGGGHYGKVQKNSG